LRRHSTYGDYAPLQEAKGPKARIQNVNPQVLFPGMAWISGTIGEYSILVACVIAKDVIMFFGAGPDVNRARDYVEGVKKDMIDMSR
jgi:hypothetical protein